VLSIRDGEEMDGNSGSGLQGVNRGASQPLGFQSRDMNVFKGKFGIWRTMWT
jgi:hypothetical protein